MAQHSNQMMFMDQSATSHATVSQINRKSSIEAKLGGQAAVGGVIKSDTSGGMNSVDTSQLNSTAASNSGGQPIRSKAQYDNWLSMQVMKKAGGTSNMRS